MTRGWSNATGEDRDGFRVVKGNMTVKDAEEPRGITEKLG